MQQIKNKEFGGERPLFASHDLQLNNVIHSYRRIGTERMQQYHRGRMPLRGKISLLARRRLRHQKLPVHRRQPGRTLVFAEPRNDRHTGGSSQDVP